MNTAQARELGKRVAALVQIGQPGQAYALLSSVLSERTPFTMLRHIGQAVGGNALEVVNPFLDRIAADRTVGGWVVIASVLEKQLNRDLAAAFARCREFIITADVWHAADAMGEGVVGQALVAHFQPALELLETWREDANAWVRRAAGTAVHFWTKRSRGAAEHTDQAIALLAFLEPMFEEWDIDAVKGVGWGLKTLGRYYPDLAADWLARHITRRHRALMLRKALTYLSDEQRARLTGQ